MQWAKTKSAGFTIVELLIVVVVIAILAAITIVSYNGITSRTYQSAVQSDLQTAMNQLRRVYIETGTFPSVPTASVGLTPTKDAYQKDRNNYYYCTNADNTAIAMTGVARDGTSYSISSIDGVIRSGLTGGGDGTCAIVGGANGSWSNGMSTNNTWQGWAN